MKEREAIEVLIKLLEKDSLNKEEKEALLTAIGVLDWVAIGKKSGKEFLKKKKKRETNTD